MSGKQFPHERLIVYQKAIEFVAWSQPIIEAIPASSAVKKQLDRASTSIPLNIAEGNPKASSRDRARFWQMAMGSAVECAACLDVAIARGMLSAETADIGKSKLWEICSILGKLIGNLGVMIAEEPAVYGDDVADKDEDEDEDEEQKAP